MLFRSVIAITAQTNDMQRQLDIVWDKLLPAFQPGVLPEDQASQDKLKQTLSGLAVRAAATKSASRP